MVAPHYVDVHDPGQRNVIAIAECEYTAESPTDNVKILYPSAAIAVDIPGNSTPLFSLNCSQCMTFAVNSSMEKR